MAAVSEVVATPVKPIAKALPLSDHARLEAQLAEEVAKAQATLRRAFELSGLKGDPLSVYFEALSQSLDAQRTMHLAQLRSYGDMAEELDRRSAEMVERVRQPLDAGALLRLEKAAASGAARQAAGMARAFALRVALVAVLVLFSAVTGAAALGYRWGTADAVASIHETEHDLADAFRNGPQDAAVWLSLIRLNDARAAVQACQHDSLWTDKAGRRACGLRVWLDPAPPSVPQH